MATKLKNQSVISTFNTLKTGDFSGPHCTLMIMMSFCLQQSNNMSGIVSPFFSPWTLLLPLKKILLTEFLCLSGGGMFQHQGGSVPPQHHPWGSERLPAAPYWVWHSGPQVRAPHTSSDPHIQDFVLQRMCWLFNSSFSQACISATFNHEILINLHTMY